ncbi:hypothetical protein [Burkholderia dolosa]|uniref:hypothetical protein n=1 Tax=Burkholderia dolosa TaxID=152500 RepID=UPI001590F79F|nr:hypothetical protein [Burkholderia dolosa]MBY4753819.1 hypothetical protein [Burkholderia dolosa]
MRDEHGCMRRPLSARVSAFADARRTLRPQQIEAAEHDYAAEHDHRDGMLAEIENRGRKPRRDAEGADAGHRGFLEYMMK